MRGGSAGNIPDEFKSMFKIDSNEAVKAKLKFMVRERLRLRFRFGTQMVSMEHN